MMNRMPSIHEEPTYIKDTAP